MYTGHKIAIVADEAGTTRDISEFEYTHEAADLSYILSDSGGLDFGSKDDIVAQDIIDRTYNAIKESDLLIWLIEYNTFSDLDEKILKILRENKKVPFLLVANKADNEDQKLEAFSQA